MGNRFFLMVKLNVNQCRLQALNPYNFQWMRCREHRPKPVLLAKRTFLQEH